MSVVRPVQLIFFKRCLSGNPDPDAAVSSRSPCVASPEIDDREGLIEWSALTSERYPKAGGGTC
jgi:hypothetical protein